MRVEHLTKPSEVSERLRPFLMRSEVANCLMLGLIGIASSETDAFDSFDAWVVLGSTDIEGAGLKVGSNNLIVGDGSTREAISALAAEVGDIPGVVGSRPPVEWFVDSSAWSATLTMNQGIYASNEVVEIPPGNGVSRPATEAELEVLVDWFIAFNHESLHRPVDSETARRYIATRISEQSPARGIWVQELDGHPVSMSSHGAPTPGGIRVSGVYTPPALRGQGFATSLVAAQTGWLLASGCEFCSLYTDLDNPTSNSIYRRIGYRLVVESAEYSFSPTT